MEMPERPVGERPTQAGPRQPVALPPPVLTATRPAAICLFVRHLLKRLQRVRKSQAARPASCGRHDSQFALFAGLTMTALQIQ